MINKYIKELTLYAIERELCFLEDYNYLINRLLDLLNLDEFIDCEINFDVEKDIDNYIEPLLDYGVQKGLIEDTITSKDAFEAKMMDILMPLPSTVNRKFKRLLVESPRKSTNYLYDMSVNSNYIKTNRVAKNINWESPSKYGVIEMTINVSKPEKTIDEIRKASVEESNYPKCPLCIENIGFRGTLKNVARNNLRAVNVVLNEEEFMFQYSPYVYYNEHSIIFKKEHIPMTIGNSTFKRLLDFVELFPHYFIGSNADLPVVGGSILNHEHYQGGAHEFPMDRAKASYETLVGSVVLRRLHWPVTVIQLEGPKEDVISLATKITDSWSNYTDIDAGIVSKTTSQHNTVTPIARLKDGRFILNIALRNNRTSDEFPDGVFHSHPKHHHIKRENLGLIEVLGLCILPSRLVSELEDVKGYLRGEKISLGLHSEWVKELELTEYQDKYINDKVTEKFINCLEDAGVFKNTLSGELQFMKFMKTII